MLTYPLTTRNHGDLKSSTCYSSCRNFIKLVVWHSHVWDTTWYPGRSYENSSIVNHTVKPQNPCLYPHYWNTSISKKQGEKQSYSVQNWTASYKTSKTTQYIESLLAPNLWCRLSLGEPLLLTCGSPVTIKDYQTTLLPIRVSRTT